MVTADAPISFIISADDCERCSCGGGGSGGGGCRCGRAARSIEAPTWASAASAPPVTVRATIADAAAAPGPPSVPRAAGGTAGRAGGGGGRHSGGGDGNGGGSDGGEMSRRWGCVRERRLAGQTDAFYRTATAKLPSLRLQDLPEGAERGEEADDARNSVGPGGADIFDRGDGAGGRGGVPPTTPPSRSLPDPDAATEERDRRACAAGVVVRDRLRRQRRQRRRAAPARTRSTACATCGPHPRRPMGRPSRAHARGWCRFPPLPTLPPHPPLPWQLPLLCPPRLADQMRQRPWRPPSHPHCRSRDPRRHVRRRPQRQRRRRRRHRPPHAVPAPAHGHGGRGRAASTGRAHWRGGGGRQRPRGGPLRGLRRRQPSRRWRRRHPPTCGGESNGRRGPRGTAPPSRASGITSGAVCQSLDSSAGGAPPPPAPATADRGATVS